MKTAYQCSACGFASSKKIHQRVHGAIVQANAAIMDAVNNTQSVAQKVQSLGMMNQIERLKLDLNIEQTSVTNTIQEANKLMGVSPQDSPLPQQVDVLYKKLYGEQTTIEEID